MYYYIVLEETGGGWPCTHFLCVFPSLQTAPRCSFDPGSCTFECKALWKDFFGVRSVDPVSEQHKGQALNAVCIHGSRRMLIILVYNVLLTLL